MPNTMTLISTVTVGSGGAATIDFNSIPSTYTDLTIKLSIRSTNSSISQNGFLRFNGSSAMEYSDIYFYADSNSTVGTGKVLLNGDKLFFADMNGGSSTSSTFSSMEIYIPSYTSSNHKIVLTNSAMEQNATQAFQELDIAKWANTSAITSISLFPSANSFAQYSVASLYGIKNS